MPCLRGFHQNAQGHVLRDVERSRVPRKIVTRPHVKVDPFAPQLLREYVEFTTRNGPFPFGEYMAHWHMVQALIGAKEAEGEDPFSLTVEDVLAALPSQSAN